MHEDFLHYLWVNKKIPFTQLQTHLNETLEIINFGQYLQNAGPDIFNAQISINHQKWAGNIEIHVNASDWYLHHHEKDCNYNNVILHVVWENDSPVFRQDNSEIPTLELKNIVSIAEINKYKALIASKTWINCENQISAIDNFIWTNWLESLFLHRLERKATEINNRLQETNNNWEAVFFEMLFKNFGLHTNGTSFLQLAQAIPFSVIRKESHFSENLEALLFGKLNWLANSYEDSYFINLQNNWKYLKEKYNLSEEIGLQPQFFKLRPDNFPTIRISQFVNLWCAKPNLFSQIMEAATYKEISKILKSETSEYWINHYNFAKTSKAKRKNVSTSFLDLLIINTIIPIKFCYQLQQGKLNTDEIITMLEAIAPEKNNIVTKFSEFNVKVTNAYQSQSLLELKNEFCNKNKCLNCAIGLQLLKN